MEAEVIDMTAGERLQHGPVTEVATPQRCVMLIGIAGDHTARVRVPLAEVRYVQGDGNAVDLGFGDTDIILRLGERQAAYDQVMTAMTAHARGCGARLVSPPPLISTPPSG